MLDFGYTAAALINNIGLLRIDPSKVRALIMSHGHIDHYGGLIGFLGQYRNAMPADLKLYAGGEDNFCHRLSGTTPGQLGEKRHAKLAELTGAYKVYFAKAEPAKASDRGIDHTGYMYLIGRDGQYIGFFPPGTSAARMVDVIRPLVEEERHL